MESFLDHFQIESEIGTDSVATAYRCITSGPEPQRVILKVIHPEILKDQKAVEHIRRSVLLFSKPLGDNVSRVLEFNQDCDNPYYLVEDIPGQDIDDWCVAPRALDVVLPVLWQAAKGLEALHGAGIIHRNIKTETILVSADGQAKIAESVVALVQGEQCNDGRIVAEIDNAPPEFIERGHFSAVGDIYALGILAFELITGRSPFNGKTLIEAMDLRLRGEVPSLSDVAPSCPTRVAHIVDRATRKDPSARYQSVTELAEALAQLCKG